MNPFKKNSLPFGLLLGALVPVLSFIVYYFSKFFPTFSFVEFWNAYAANKSFLTGISTISLVANVVLFTLYTNSRKDATARGIFIITILFGIPILLFKWLG